MAETIWETSVQRPAAYAYGIDLISSLSALAHLLVSNNN